MKLLTESHQSAISLVIGCFDRIIISGSLPEISYSTGMTSYLFSKGIRVFDYPKFCEPFKEQIRANAERIAKENGIEIKFLRSSKERKESIVSEIIKERGVKEGLICILSAMETCPTFKPWHNKSTGANIVKGDISKCLHYYFYFIDEYAGLCYVRVPTWMPFRLQVYVNGHNLLASELRKEGIEYTMIDNAFDSISDPIKAQELSDNLGAEKLKERLDAFAWQFCPVYKELGFRYHWSIEQVEYATDIVFKEQAYLQRIYGELIATAIHTVKPENIATFLGRKLDDRYQGEAGNNYRVRIEGCRIKHSMGKASIKMYDKFGKILRLETTTYDPTFFKNYREVVHRDGTKSNKNAHVKKTIFSLPLLADCMKSANRRYLEYISSFDNKEVGRERMEKVTQPKQENNRNYKGFNFFDNNDVKLLLSIINGKFNISGMRNKDLQLMLGYSSAKVSRLLKRLWMHGLLKKVKETYKYYLTKLGKEVIVTAQNIKELVVIPSLCY